MTLLRRGRNLRYHHYMDYLDFYLYFPDGFYKDMVVESTTTSRSTQMDPMQSEKKMVKRWPHGPLLYVGDLQDMNISILLIGLVTSLLSILWKHIGLEPFDTIYVRQRRQHWFGQHSIWWHIIRDCTRLSTVMHLQCWMLPRANGLSNLMSILEYAYVLLSNCWTESSEIRSYSVDMWNHIPVS